MKKAINAVVGFGGKLTGMFGRKAFGDHDALGTWDDSGETARISIDIHRTIAEQVKQGVIDYLEDGAFEYVMQGDKMFVAFRVANEKATLTAYVDPVAMLETALEDAETSPDGKRFFIAQIKTLTELLNIVNRKHNSFRSSASEDAVRDFPDVKTTGGKVGRSRESNITEVDIEAAMGDARRR